MRAVMMSFAESIKEKSKCEERKVAAVIATKDMQRVVSIGLNGGPKGGADCLCVTQGKYGCIHAEINALLKAPGYFGDTEMVMFVTLAPCKQCAAAIINSHLNIVEVVFSTRWKETHGVDLLESRGITCTYCPK